jgi:hypothetical protein
MVFVAQGAYSAEYKVTINGTNIFVKTGDGSATTAPNYASVSHGTAPTDAVWPAKQQASTTRIAEYLTSAINAAIGADTATQIGSSVYITRNASYTIAVSDSQSGNGLKLIHEEVQSFLDLPAEGKHGFTVKVAGEPDDEGDEYWVKFDASNVLLDPASGRRL